MAEVVLPYYIKTFNFFSEWSLGDASIDIIVFTDNFSQWNANDVHIIKRIHDETDDSITLNGIHWCIGQRLGSWTGSRVWGTLITNRTITEIDTIGRSFH
jgi:hypothetical protein